MHSFNVSNYNNGRRESGNMSNKKIPVTREKFFINIVVLIGSH